MKRISIMLAAMGIALSSTALEKPSTPEEITGIYYMEGIVNEQNMGWAQRNVGTLTISLSDNDKLTINNFYYRGLSYEIEFDATAQTITIPLDQVSTSTTETSLTVYNYNYDTRKKTPVVLSIDTEHRVIRYDGTANGRVNNVIALGMPGATSSITSAIASAYIWYTNSQMQTRTQEQYNQGTSSAYPIWVEMKDGNLIVDNFAGKGFWSYPITLTIDKTNKFAYANDQVVTEIDGIKYDLWGSADGALDEKSVGFVGAAVEGQDGWWSLTAGGTIGILNENYTSTFPPTTTSYDQFFVESVIFMPFNPFMSGIENINADNNAPVEYFNLQGIRVSNPSNGVYIRRQGNTASKVLIK